MEAVQSRSGPVAALLRRKNVAKILQRFATKIYSNLRQFCRGRKIAFSLAWGLGLCHGRKIAFSLAWGPEALSWS
jgi:hypothetical protein